MGVLSWIGLHWIDLLQSAGIIGSLTFSAFSLRRDTKARRISNLIAIAKQHGELWREMYDRPELSRVLESGVDLAREPVSKEEHLFVNLLILHLDSVHRATKSGMFVKLEGLQKDIEGFFSLPIPAAVWGKAKLLHDADFVRFVETNRRRG